MSLTLFRRMLRRAFREARRIGVPGIAIPLVVPVFMLVVFARVFTSVTAIPGFGATESYVQYIAAAALLMSSMLSSTAAVSVAVERQNGFYDRMRISPKGPMISNLARRIADAAKMAMFAAILIAVARVNGAEVENWPLVVLLGILLPTIWGLAYQGFAFAMCLRLGKPEAGEVIIPLFFPLLFISSGFIPVELLPSWMRDIAYVNPLTYISDTIRGAFRGSVDGQTFLLAMLGIGSVLLFTQLLVRRAERHVAQA